MIRQNLRLDEHVDPTGEEIREELANNLFGCGTYAQYPKATLEAAGKLHTAGEE